MFTFTPLLGAQSPSQASQNLLEFDGGVKILVDVGWDGSFDAQMLKELERQVPTISLILLTHPTLARLGAFAHCCKNIPLFSRIPVYATSPVIALGRTLLQDLYASTPLAASFLQTSALSDSAFSLSDLPPSDKSSILLQPPTHDEIAHYFREIHPLKYSQAHQPLSSPFSPPLEGLTVTAFSAGHTVGGTIWHIQHGSESVVYAVDWNQAKENILSGAAWLGSGNSGAEVIEQLRRPTALICSSRGIQRSTLSGGWKRRDEMLIDCVRSVIKNGASVLIPCDSSARVLEMAYVLEHAWRADTNSSDPACLRNAKLYLTGRSYGATMQHTRRMLEWMNEAVVREFEATASTTQPAGGAHASNNRADGLDKDATHPFELKFIKILEKKSQIDKARTAPGPKVFLASDASLDWGYAKDLLKDLASEKNNLVILSDQTGAEQTSPTNGSSLMQTLYSIWEEGQGDQGESRTEISEKAIIVDCSGKTASVTQVDAVALGGQEIAVYQQYLAGLRQRQTTTNVDSAAKLESSADVVDEGSSSSSSSSGESDAELQGRALNLAATMNSSKHKLGLTDDELGVNILLRRKGVYDYDVRGKRGRERLFPYVSKRRRTDDFGDLIRPEEYLRAEERDENDTDEKHSADKLKDSSLGQKLKWGNAHDGKGERGRRPSADGHGDGRDGHLDRDHDDDSDESDYEPAEATIQGPTKAVITMEEVRLDLRVTRIDYSGLHDKRSLQMLLPLIGPRKLILTSGDADETQALAAECRKLFEVGSDETSSGSRVDVFSPVNGVTVDASVDTNAWTIRLSQLLVSGLQWQNVRGLGVVTVTGRIKAAEPAEDDQQSPKRVKLEHGAAASSEEQGEDGKLAPTLDILPAHMASATRVSTQPLHVGDLRLADLRRLMQMSGHKAEFKGEGTLLVDGMIVVRKSGVGKIEVEAATSFTPGLHAQPQHGASFYHVKKRIYESLAVVSAR